MDDLLKSMSNEEDLIQLSSKLLIILSDCGFRLTKFYVEFNKCIKPFAGKRNITENKEIRFDRISSRTSGQVFRPQRRSAIFTQQHIINDDVTSSTGLYELATKEIIWSCYNIYWKT